MSMSFKTGIFIGFAAGYVLGSKAGRERYDQIRRTAEKAWGSRPAEKLRSTAAVAAGDVGHKAVEVVKHLRPGSGDGAEDLLRDIDPLVTAARGDGNF